MGVTPCSVPILQTVSEVTGTYELPRQKPLLNRCVPLIPLGSSNQEDQLWPLLPQAKPILARRRGPPLPDSTACFATTQRSSLCSHLRRALRRAVRESSRLGWRRTVVPLI